MADRNYKSGASREQGMLFPVCIEDYVSDTNPVRSIDIYIDSLNLESMGFTNTTREVASGQPAYSPYDLLKLYLYGYMNRILSSRGLEREAHRNVEVMWLLKNLTPSYKTIADFRKNNLTAIKEVNKDFVMVCKELDLFGKELVAIDGSFFKGNASNGSIFTKKKLENKINKLETSINKYINKLNENDNNDQAQSGDDPNLKKKLKRLVQRQTELKVYKEVLEVSDESQLSLTDTDARLLKKYGRQTVGYNVQAAVDSKHKLLVTCEVVNDGNDVEQLFPMCRKAKEQLGVDNLDAVADSGYYNQVHLKKCQDNSITPYVSIPDKTGSSNKNISFGRNDFIYDKKNDVYQCPTGHTLIKHSIQRKGEKLNVKYASNAKICKKCPHKEQCLPEKTKYKQIYRYEHEDVVEEHRIRMLKKGRDMMKTRASLAEHPFGTLKLWCGWTHFLMRGLNKVRAEMNLLMLSYNFKRVLNIIGLDAFREYCLQRRLNKSALKGVAFTLFCIFMTVAKNICRTAFHYNRIWSKPRLSCHG